MSLLLPLAMWGIIDCMAMVMYAWDQHHEGSPDEVFSGDFGAEARVLTSVQKQEF